MYTPRKASEAMKNLGAHLRMARKRRMWTIADLAKKVEVSSPTIIALEKGEPTVSIGVLISTLWVLGLDHEFQQLTQPHDEQGIALMNSRLPKKVRVSKRKLDNDF